MLDIFGMFISRICIYVCVSYNSVILKFRKDLIHENRPISGYVDFVEASESGVKGRLFIEQRYPFKPVTIHGRIYGLKKGFHGFHIHQNGELGNNCKDAGPHFNPFKVSDCVK